MNESQKNIEAQVFEFTAQAIGVPITRLKLTTSLFHDLGVDGADAAEFMEQFARNFQVNMSDFKLERHFGREASFDPIHWLTSRFPHGHSMDMKQFAPITLGNLVTAAHT